MRKFAYVGAGRLSRQIASFVEVSLAPGSFQSLYFGQPSEALGGITVVSFERYLEDEFSDFEFYLGLGYHQLRKKRAIMLDLRRKGRMMRSLIHATAYVHPSSKIGDGCVIYPGAVVGPECVLQGAVLLNTSVNLSHDVTIGEAAYLSPSVAVSGFCRIGAETFLGTGSLIANDVSIGERCRLGIGSVVTHSLSDDVHGLGNPFREVGFDLH